MSHPSLPHLQRHHRDFTAFRDAMIETAVGRFGPIWWGVWAMIQHTVSHIDFDYMEWGMERVGRAEAVVNDPDHQRWLAAQ